MSPVARPYDWRLPPSSTGAPARLTVATCQFPVRPDPAANLADILGLVGRGAALGADLVHFPECALSGYGTAAWPSWDGFDWAALDAATAQVCAAARQHRVWVAFGSAHRATPDRLPTNCLHVVDREGRPVARYDKARCSVNDLRAFAPGDRPVMLEIEGVRVGILICLDWAFPELWQGHADAGVELVLISASSDADGGAPDRPMRNQAHTIPPLMQGYGFLHCFAISLSNSCRPRQDFPSLWVERSGHLGAQCRRDEPGMIVSALSENAEQDAFFRMVRDFRRRARDGSLYAEHRPPAGR
jgi:predicted amidohydrolase